MSSSPRVCAMSLLLIASQPSGAQVPAQAAPLQATEQASPDVPPDIAERLRSFTVRRGLRNVARTVQVNRAAVKSNSITLAAAAQVGGVRVSGRREIPVLLSLPHNVAKPPYRADDLQRELFGAWPSGTMTDYYREVSYGAFTVTGSVLPWARLPLDDGAYEGADPAPDERCNALCPGGQMVRFVEDSIAAQDDAVDFRRYDNDGADGLPDSGDDDGYVDFVALVHPETGGECGNRNIWSHRFSLTDWGVGPYETNDVGKSGKPIRIDDYVVMPGLSCDGRTMIEIGVFAHEFGHAFGLPDLYDANGRSGGFSEGIGNWGLMGAGSWGGDGVTPSRPTHMSAWEKEFLGWVSPQTVRSDRLAVGFGPVEKVPQVLRIPISDEEYYLVEYRSRTGFDDSLRGSGLLVWKVNATTVANGLASNSVNADPTRLGLKLMEADGLDDLVEARNRGDDGDLFRGSKDRRAFDNATVPASVGSVAICNIGTAGPQNVADLLVSRGRC